MTKFLIISLIVLWIVGWLFKGQKSHGTVRIKSKELPTHEHRLHQASHDETSVKPKSEVTGEINNTYNAIKQPNDDIINPECPYCHHELIKSPARKTKCPYCGQFIYVRKRPKDKIRVLATKDEADKIDAEWSTIHEDDFFNSFMKKEDMESERMELRERFGKEPSIYDVAWGVLGKQGMEHAKNGNWDLYSNTHCLRAQLLEKESKLKEALQEYLLMCFLDLNGPMNVGNLDEFPDLKQRYPPFDPKSASLAPGIVNAVKDISERLDLNLDEIKSLFMQKGEVSYQSLKLPLSPIDCWSKLEKELIDK